MADSLLRLDKVRERVGLSRSGIYAKIATGEFPRPVALGKRSVAWVESEVAAWVEARIAGRRTAPAFTTQD